MKREIIVLLAVFFTLGLAGSVNAKDARPDGVMLAQNKPAEVEDFLGDEEEDFDAEAAARSLEADRKKREEEERKRVEEETRKAEEAKRVAIKKRQVKDRKIAEQKTKELDALREAAADSTEYTVEPSSVELVVEMDPNGYGFRTRNHRMVLSGDFDFILRGRGLLHYDYRFFEYLSFGVLAGVDWSDLSLYSRFRDQMAKPYPKQFSILGGISSQWRLTEWYMRSAFFLEPSVIFGHMWQTLPMQKSTHWRLRPGLFGGVETVFDSGFSLAIRVGAEVPLDFGSPNPFVEWVEPLFLVSFGFAI